MPPGYKKGQIMNSTGGMYLGFGTGSSDFNYLEKASGERKEGLDRRGVFEIC